MQIDPASASVRDVYHWMVHTILPRPIAWVSTVDPAGRANLAPFSFFMGVCAMPPTLMFCPVNDRRGQPKDTLRNVTESRDFVVNLVPASLCKAMNDTAASLPHGESEFDRFNIPSIPALRVRPPRVAGAPVAFECALDRVIHVGEGPAGGNIVLGRILLIHVSDDVLGPEAMPDLAKMDLVARAGADVYLRGGECIRMPRPD